MEAKYFSFKDDYNDLIEWWSGWGWDTYPYLDTLPPTGIIIINNGKKICNCFIYKTDSSWAVINWILINPKTNKQERKGCLEYMIEQATLECKKMGFKLIDIMIDEKVNFINKAKQQGYLATETLTRIIKRV